MKRRPEKEFRSMIRPTVTRKVYQRMKHIRHHLRGNLYEHSIKVAYLCYRCHRACRMCGDRTELVQGALLHDFYLYDPHAEKGYARHWVAHPRRALCNAQRYYGPLTAAQRDMIERHMFPVTPLPPRTPYGWMICLCDKLAAVHDLFGAASIRKGPLL